MDFPRRFYMKPNGGEKKLKYDEKLIKACKWCGTFFLDYEAKRLCSKYCRKWYLFWSM